MEETAKLISSNGEIEFRVSDGKVVSHSLDSEFGCYPHQIDVEEWRSRYPNEELKCEHDVLDFGYWYCSIGGLLYEPPCEEWRSDMNAEMTSRVVRYKVWLHMEGLNRDGDTLEGDDHFPPVEIGCFEERIDAIKLVDYLQVISDAVKYIGGFPDDQA